MNVPRAKVFAGLLLFIFLVQCLWLVHAELRSEFGCYPESAMVKQGRVIEGLAQWKRGRIAGTANLAGSQSLPDDLHSVQVSDHYHSCLLYTSPSPRDS